jgi:hypothetical protein
MRDQTTLRVRPGSVSSFSVTEELRSFGGCRHVLDPISGCYADRSCSDSARKSVLPSLPMLGGGDTRTFIGREGEARRNAGACSPAKSQSETGGTERRRSKHDSVCLSHRTPSYRRVDHQPDLLTPPMGRYAPISIRRNPYCGCIVGATLRHFGAMPHVDMSALSGTPGARQGAL